MKIFLAILMLSFAPAISHAGIGIVCGFSRYTENEAIESLATIFGGRDDHNDSRGDNKIWTTLGSKLLLKNIKSVSSISLIDATEDQGRELVKACVTIMY